MHTQILNPERLWLFFFFLLFAIFPVYAQQDKQPIIVNGDNVEYSAESKEVTARGNVLVNYKGAKLTCEKLTLNTATKDVEAEGNVRLDDKSGVVEGERIKYNFQNKTGTVISSDFRATPYFGKSERVKKVSENEFIAYRGYMSTCSYDNPHYRIKSRKMAFFPGDKIQTRDSTLYLGRVPLFYLPQYNHSLRDPLVHVQVMPGSKKDWGKFLLTAWRFNVNDNVKGRIYLDYREKLGVAEGFGLNYTTQDFGRGDYKYYYTQERSREFKEGVPAEFQRYFIRWRHKWELDERTDLTSQYYKIVDSKRMIHGTQYNILKDYFFREYEKDTQPLSYTSLHHSFDYSSLDFILQKRTNRWYSQLEKLPELTFNLPSYKIGETPFYFTNTSQLANFNYKYSVPSSSTNDINMKRIDLTNKFSLPLKVAFIRLNPFVQNRETYYDQDVNGSSIPPRTVFYSGVETSTKFYRLFEVKSNFLGMKINRLRHIITPTINYSYNHEPTIANSKLKQIDSVDSVGRSNTAALELSNKLQTKRDNSTVDVVDFRVSSTYTFKPKEGSRRGSSFSDFLFELDLLPYSWMRLSADATYNHYEDYFSNANYDINFNFGQERTVAVGNRYQRKGGKELTFDADWRLNPKWKFGIYERYQFVQAASYKKGLREQEYFIARDLHCWIAEVTYNIKRDEGETIWLIFRLKAFPELEFEFNQGYHRPKAGSQS